MSKVYIVAVDMGYGHQRAVFPLEHIATVPEGWEVFPSPIISSNVYPGIPDSDKKQWEETRKIYEWVSRMRVIPYLGIFMFSVMDYFQRIEVFYPKRDLSEPTLQVRQIDRMVKAGLGKHLIDTLNKNPLPLLTSFFIPAIFAEEHGYKGKIYCLCTDTDISRAWVPIYPERSKIIYLAPNHRVKERLLLYGVKEENIIATGFPLPVDSLGGEKETEIAKEILNRRIIRLDPSGLYREKYSGLISQYLNYSKDIEDQAVSLTFAVGGAGAQSEIGLALLVSLKNFIKEDKIKLNLVVGVSKVLFEMYSNFIENNSNLSELYKDGRIKIIYNEDKFSYFREFNETIIKTDILWTKPSELSFYTGLGLPIIIASPLGSQEESNREWLYSLEAGCDQKDPTIANEWLIDWINDGRFAEMAMNGFINAPKCGTFHIESLLLNEEMEEIEKKHSI